MNELLSETMLSNLFTMTASKQKIPDKGYQMPGTDTRQLRARLILEEALETIHALGGTWIVNERGALDIVMIPDPNMEGIIDGVCDLHYVAIGTLAACGVPDLPHVREVNAANNAKFPNGQGVPHPTIPNKFGKPLGWTPPSHEFIQEEMEKVGLNLKAIGQKLVEEQNEQKST